MQVTILLSYNSVQKLGLSLLVLRQLLHWVYSAMLSDNIPQDKQKNLLLKKEEFFLFLKNYLINWPLYLSPEGMGLQLGSRSV